MNELYIYFFFRVNSIKILLSRLLWMSRKISNKKKICCEKGSSACIESTEKKIYIEKRKSINTKSDLFYWKSSILFSSLKSKLFRRILFNVLSAEQIHAPKFCIQDLRMNISKKT